MRFGGWRPLNVGRGRVYGARMSIRARLVLATSLSLAGCYSGADLSGGSSGEGGSTGEASNGEATTETSGADSGVVTTGGGETGSATASSGVPEPSTSEDTSADTTTTGPVDPSAGTTSGTTSGDTGMMPGPTDVPDGPACADVADWSPAWAQLELDVLAIVNQVRSQGANCGSKGAFGPAGPLTMHPALRCAARKHSVDMAVRNFFDHINPDGETPWDRMGKAGYGGYSAAGENIAAGSPDAAGTMDQWMTSDGHCANIMNPAFEHIGVGYSTGGQYGHLWTQVFGAK